MNADTPFLTLTDMDNYEQKYKEALGRASHIKDDSMVATPQEVAEYLFPELRDSEDERIRKEILHEISTYPPAPEGLIKKETLDRWIAWLEKQKDKCKDCPSRGNTHSYLKGYEDGQKEQNPAEWSEEDEAIRIEVIKLLSNPSLYEACEHLREESVDWLKTLHTKVNVNSEKVSANSEKVNVNWSEEDEKMLKCCLIAINHYEKTCNIGDHLPTKFNIEGYLTSVDKVKSWLKSLRPSWKPSGEQMVMLRAVINDPNNAGAEGCQLALRELYEQLKKLT